jgi:protein TonB
MRFLREIMTSVSVLCPLSRWWPGYFRRPVYLGNETASANRRSTRLLFFSVSSLLHAAAIFSLAATPSPKRASAIEVTLFGPPSSVEYGEVALPGGQEKKPQTSERKAPPRARKERGEAKAAEAESAAQSTAHSLAQALSREIPTVAAMEGGGEGQSTEARSNGQVAAGNPPGGGGAAKHGTDDHTLSQYLRLVRERIGRYKKYPFIARKRGLEGEVGVRFLLTGAGEAQLLAISRSSGQEILDRAALKAVEDGAPFPRPPADLLAEPITIELNIVFNLS